MPPLNRVLWYIYTRNFVQKGGSFTHFAHRDYRFFTAFVKKHPLNLGHWIFQEMIRFKFSSRKASYFPFPSLISVILYYHKIWYVGPPEVMKYPPMFGKAQLNLMKLSFEEGSGQSRAPSRSQARSQPRVTQSRAQEAQSAPPPPSSLPSDFEDRFKAMIDSAIASLSIRMEFEIGRLVRQVEQGNNDLVDAQEAMRMKVETVLGQNAELQDQVAELTKKNEALSDHIIDLDASISTHKIATTIISENVSKILTHLQLDSPAAPGPSQPSSSSAPFSSSPSFVFHSSPIQPSPPAAPTPTTPSTEVLHIPPTPSTEIIHLSPVSAPSQFEDDKGGEDKDSSRI